MTAPIAHLSWIASGVNNSSSACRSIRQQPSTACGDDCAFAFCSSRPSDRRVRDPSWRRCDQSRSLRCACSLCDPSSCRADAPSGTHQLRSVRAVGILDETPRDQPDGLTQCAVLRSDVRSDVLQRRADTESARGLVDLGNACIEPCVDLLALTTSLRELVLAAHQLGELQPGFAELASDVGAELGDQC